ncbi:MAG: bifunctional DNA-formamidopyrimidine glycosylase/DNA-(apurinic or apyrimidinic site) lyase [Acidobacteria bacterium]|nr:bifunctional DNA-formamidopyrimidine glycosylase/DNA-(apurinic or apyrimidinic site) lyase [Acidobacteriota bacterium]
MPELPEVDFVRRMLAPVMTGARVEALLVRRATLRIPFPAGFEERLVGHTVTAVTRRAKYLLAALSSGETLIVHLGMSGWFRVERAAGPEFDAEPGETDDDPKHDHVVFRLSSGMLVTFNDPRRFGLMDLAAAGELASHKALKDLGPEPLSAEFDAAVLARACHRRKTPIKVALLDQTVVAGVGNIYASEACFEARISPKRTASAIATSAGTPRPQAVALAAAVVKVLERAIAKPTARFKVYERAGTPCPRRSCEGTIRRIVQAGRSTFYCPACQR